jgi:outer membrane murein-binding lipoprotein Lpp
MNTKKLDDLLTSYDALQATIKPLLNEQDNIKAAIKAALDEIKLDNYASGRVSASKFTTTRVSYDSKILEQIFKPKQLEPARRETSFEQVRISITKEGGEK